MADIKTIIDVAEKKDIFLNNMIDDHQRRLYNSIRELENKMVGMVSEFRTSEGNLMGPRVNMKQAQKVHSRLTSLFDETYGVEVRSVVAGLDDAADFIQRSFSELGVAANFTSVDKGMIDALKRSTFGTFNQFGAQARERMIDAMYGAVVGQSSFSALVNEFRGAMSGAVDVRGRPMSTYASLYANDAVMNFHNSVNMKKAADVGINNFLYYGNIMSTSRDFCIARVGKVYTKEDIDSWNGMPWRGKSGPPFTNRGGYNCRHSWVAVKPSWISDPDDLLTEMEERKRLATVKMSTALEDRRLTVTFKGGRTASWVLPTDRGDIGEIKRVLDSAKAFAESNGATAGQLAAVRKKLTDNKYYLTKKKGVVKPRPTPPPKPKPTPPPKPVPVVEPPPPLPVSKLSSKDVAKLKEYETRLVGQKSRVAEIISKRDTVGITAAETNELTALRKAIYGVEKRIQKLTDKAGIGVLPPGPTPVAAGSDLEAAYQRANAEFIRMDKLYYNNRNKFFEQYIMEDYFATRKASRVSFNKWMATVDDYDVLMKEKEKIITSFMNFESNVTAQNIISSEAKAVKGLGFLPIDLLGEMKDLGWSINVRKKYIRAHHRAATKSCHLYIGSDSSTYTHEFAHAMDDFFGKLDKEYTGFRKRMGGAWEDSEWVRKSDGDNFRAWFNKQHTGEKGKYGNKDGYYWRDNWITDYEGRIYDGGNDGIEWWSMNMERYGRYRKKLDETREGIARRMKVLSSPDNYDLKKVQDAYDDLKYWDKIGWGKKGSTAFTYYEWDTVKKHYPELSEFIEELFNTEFLSSTASKSAMGNPYDPIDNKILESIKKYIKYKGGSVK